MIRTDGIVTESGLSGVGGCFISLSLSLVLRSKTNTQLMNQNLMLKCLVTKWIGRKKQCMSKKLNSSSS